MMNDSVFLGHSSYRDWAAVILCGCNTAVVPKLVP